MNELIFKVKTDSELKECYPVLKELRPHLPFEDYVNIYKQAHSSDGYEIVAVRKNPSNPLYIADTNFSENMV